MISFNDVLKKISFFTESPRPPCYGGHFHRCSHIISVPDAEKANAEPVSTSPCEAEVKGVICIEI